MIEPQSIRLAVCHQSKNKTMSGLKHGLTFHANTSQIIRIEKAPVIDVVRRDPPVGEAKCLRFDKFMEFLEAVSIRSVAIARRATDRVDDCNQTLRNLRSAPTKLSQPVLMNLFVA